MDDTRIGRHGSCSRKDALTRLGRYELRVGQEAGRWLSPWPGVLVEASRAAEPLTMISAAVVLGGASAVVSGPSAAYLHGCRSVSPTPVHLTVPYEHWLRSRPGLVVHNGVLPADDLQVVELLPVLSLDRTVVDLLCGRRPCDALALLDEALAMIDPERREPHRAALAERIACRRDPRGTRRGAQLLGLATGRAESPAESWLLWRVVDSGFPVPEVNWSLIGIDGFELYRLDLAWPELRILLEHHGHAAHAGRTRQDEARAEDLRRRGWIVVEVRAADHADPTRFLSELDRAFRSRGVDTSRRTVGTLRGRRHREPGARRPRLADTQARLARAEIPTRAH